ncbi:MAG: Bax inhibitor-1/YccA family protein [Lachnospiraceae bacterium]|nr:Bax inhibitor-1/YccA family protein [Lachnospiraceae bacterium]
MESYESYNNGQFTPPRYEEYQDAQGFQSYEDLSGGFEAGNPVTTTLHQLKSLMFEEVIAKAFLFMVAALGITAFAAYSAPYFMLNWLVKNPFGLYLLFGAEIAIVLVSNSVLKKNNVVLAAVLYTIYSYLTGATIGIICLAYTGASVASVFLMTAGMFGVMAIYGLITKRDLSSLGSLFMMGLVGIIIAGLVNILILHSSAVEFGISIVGVLIFVGLTAYDVQKLKNRVAFSDSSSVTAIAMAGAFELYLDFINLFLKLLRLFGKRK